jgi:hypothetical protein
MKRNKMNTQTARKDKWLTLTILLAVVTFGVFILGRNSEDASAVGESNEFSLSVLQPADENLISQQPKMVRDWLESETVTVSARANGEPAEVRGLGGSSLSGDDAVVVAAIGEETCALLLPQGLSSCADAEDISDGKVFGAAPNDCETYQVIGMLGNNVNSLRVSPEGSPSYTIKAQSNIYSGDFEAARTSIAGLDESGNQIFETWLPLDEYRAHNPQCGDAGGQTS